MTTPRTRSTSGRRGPGTRADDQGQALVVRDLVCAYGNVTAIRALSLDVPAGAVVAVLGSNGAGKTTLMRALSGTLRLNRGRVAAGRIAYGELDLVRSDPARIVRSGVVQVPEGRRVFGRLTVQENLDAGAVAAKDRSVAERKQAEALDLFPRLRDRLGQRAGLLSGGEQQMLAIARGLMSDPRLLLLDEPSLGLAPRLADQLFEAIAEINRSGTSILVVEQDASKALAIAEQGYVLELGRVSLSRPAAQLASSDEVRRIYLGHGNSPGGGAAPGGAPAPVPGAPRSGAERPAVQVDSLTMRFGGLTALDRVSFTVDAGTIHAIIGPNGAGKSTCFNVLSRVYEPSAGRVLVFGRDMCTLAPHAVAEHGVARAFQTPVLSGHSSVLDNLLLGRHHLAGRRWRGFRRSRVRTPRSGDRDRVLEIAHMLGLGPHLHEPAGQLAYGIQKRVDIARALCTEPRLLLLDEPVAGMDATESAAVGETIQRIHESLGLTVVLVEHDIGLVMRIAHRVTVLDFGACIADGPPAAVREHPAVIEAYLGRSAHRPDEEAGT